MADSIAKLAVIITGDASPLGREMVRAERIVTGSSVKMSSALSALKGNWSAAFMVGGPAALGITAAALGIRKMAAAGDELMQKIGADKLETWAGQWERVNEQIGIMGMRFTLIAREASSDLADLLSGVNEALFPDAVAHINALKAREAAEKRMTEEKKKQEESNKRQLRLNKEAAEAQQRERDAMLDMANARRDRADQIRESVMSPAEEMQRTFQELRSMFGDGLIDEQTAMRAGMKAREAFDNASGGRLKDRGATPGVGAAERFTSAGVSAMYGGQRELQRLEQLEKQQLDKAAKAEGQRQQIIDLLRNQPPGIEVVQGDL